MACFINSVCGGPGPPFIVWIPMCGGCAFHQMVEPARNKPRGLDSYKLKCGPEASFLFALSIKHPAGLLGARAVLGPACACRKTHSATH